jgi:hypothetical protein
MDKSVTNNSEKSLLLDFLNDHKFFGIIINKILNVSSEKLKNKILEILKLLNSKNIDSDNLRRIVFEGLPDDIPSLRSLIWKLLLNYLPLNVESWEDNIDSKRNDYLNLKKTIYSKLDLEKIRKSGKTENKIEILDKDMKKTEKCSNNSSDSNQTKPKKVLKKKNTSDHPLAVTENSRWKNYFDDLELLEEIDKDVRRTRTHMHFFFMPARTNLQPISNDLITEMADKKRNEPGSTNIDKFFQKSSFESNADIMCRILFIYGKKYPEIRYVQGMNEILAPIYFSFSNDQNPYFYTNLEADSFICFENLMEEIKDIFIRIKDNSETGIHTRIKNLNALLKVVDKEIYNHFFENKVEIQYFAFRWFTLFLTQEFEMPDILRLWDSILSFPDKFEFLNTVCLAIIKAKKSEILQSDFAGIMLALQSLDKLDIEKIIKIAEVMHNDLNKNIY